MVKNSDSTASGGSRVGKMRPLVIAGLIIIGLARSEDRAIIGVPSLAPDAMAAMAIQPSDEDDRSFADAPSGAVPVSNAGTIPRERILRALADRDFTTAAAQGAIPGAIGPAAIDPALSGAPGAAQAAQQAALNAFTPSPDSVPVILANAAPGLPSQGNSLFAANIPQAGGDGGTGNGGTGNGGTGSGGTGNGGAAGGGTGGGTDGGAATPPGQTPVAAVPEPQSWLLLIFGIFGIGAAMRKKVRLAQGLGAAPVLQT